MKHIIYKPSYHRREPFPPQYPIHTESFRFQAYFRESENIEAALPTEIKFEISEDGSVFETVNTAAPGTDVSYNLPESRKAKAVAFTIGLGFWVTTEIAELEVYGKDETAIGASGTIDFKPIFDQAYANGMKDWYVEVERYDGTPQEDVQKSYDFLNNAAFVK